MLYKIKRYKADETGAITVDWVVLTAAVIGLATLMYSILSQSLSTSGQPIRNVEVEEMDFN